MPGQQRLAAIMFTDIVGYTSLMGTDEQAAMSLLRANRRLHKSIIKKFKGKWLKEMGDGTLASFTTISDAVYCASALMEACVRENIQLRIGIHFGEITEESGDIFGDGVNVASRIEPLADSGSILVSEPIHRKVKNKTGITSIYKQEADLKNVDGSLRLYEISVDDIPASQMATDRFAWPGRRLWLIAASIAVLLLIVYSLSQYMDEDVPEQAVIAEKSVAVLPFKNMSGDRDLEPFCDGMTDAVISRLSKINALAKVSSRTSVFKYKGSNKGLPEIATELDVNYILESSFQKDGNRIKINLQLIDAATDNHLWSEEYFDVYEDKFRIQAQVAENVAEKLNANISSTEMATIRKIPTENDKAYNLYLQAEFLRHKATEQAYEVAIPLYEQAIELDSNFAAAYLGLAKIWSWGGLVWGVYDQEEAKKNSNRLFKKALELDSTNFEIKDRLYANYFYYNWDFDKVDSYYLELPGMKNKYSVGGHTECDYFVKTGRYQAALERANFYINREPSNPNLYPFKAQALMFLGRNEEALQLLYECDPLYSDDYWYLRESTKFYFYMEDYPNFKDNLSKIMQYFPGERPPIVLWFNAVLHHLENNSQKESLFLNRLQDEYETNKSGSPAWFIALYYFVKEDADQGFSGCKGPMIGMKWK